MIPPHVLVVDDDEPSLLLAARVLAHAGYRVTGRPWPDLAPGELAALAPDAVLLDLRFGGRPLGLGFLDEVKADPTTAAIPVLVCSADVWGVRAAGERLAAAAGVLLKPYRAADLVAAVGRCLAEADDRARADAA